MMARSSRRRFKICLADLLRNRLIALAEQADRLGNSVRDQFVQSLRIINSELETDPLQWGDPLYPLKKLKLKTFHRLHQMLLVKYAVDEKRRVVYLRDII